MFSYQKIPKIFRAPGILVQVYEEDQISHTHKQALQNSH